jgi:hypothetical protein
MEGEVSIVCYVNEGYHRFIICHSRFWQTLSSFALRLKGPKETMTDNDITSLASQAPI